MKRSLTLLTFLSLLAGVAVADQVWSAGVTTTDGWYDANKTSNNSVDDLMCYAASAANLIAWWQEHHAPASTAPTDIDEIWDAYRAAGVSPSQGGDTRAAIIWWISGVCHPTNPAESERSIFSQSTSSPLINTSEGYYFDQCSLTRNNVWDFVLADDVRVGEAPTDEGLVSLMTDGMGVSLSIAADNGQLAHAITLWGLEYEGSGSDTSISKLWVTDSDDDDNTLIAVDVKHVEGRLYFDKAGEIGSYVNSGYWDGGNFVNHFDYGNGIYVSDAYAINPAESKSWISSVPEPATATLSLLALAGLAARRRRS